MSPFHTSRLHYNFIAITYNMQPDMTDIDSSWKAARVSADTIFVPKLFLYSTSNLFYI